MKKERESLRLEIMDILHDFHNEMLEAAGELIPLHRRAIKGRNADNIIALFWKYEA
jgi:hypothetical protein